MGKKYTSMQEQLAARKAAAGYETPQRAKAGESAGRALSGRLKGAIDKGSRKAARQAKNRGHKGVNWKKALGMSLGSDEGWRTGSRLEDPDEARIYDGSDGLEIDGFDGELIGSEAAEGKSGGFFDDDTEAGPKILLGLLALTFVLVAAMGIFSGTDYDEDTWDNDMTGIYDLTAESTDEEVMDAVNDELSYYGEIDQDELSQWIEDTDIGKLVGKEIISWHCDHGDSYVRLMAHFENDDIYEVEEACNEASSSLQEALEESDFEETPAVVIVARSKDDESLMLVTIDNSTYYRAEDVVEEDLEEDEY